MNYIETTMLENTYHSPVGNIRYWVSRAVCENGNNVPWLIFLPGLTADHTTFEAQIAKFQNQYNCFVWDAPAHGQSRPASLYFSLADMAQYLHDIFALEQIQQYILIGHSMGGYLSQQVMTLYPGETAGFISIDSAPLEQGYYAAWELFSVKHTEGMYRSIPWKSLLQLSASGNAETAHGRAQMRDMMIGYTRDEFCALTGYGFRILAEAVETCTSVVPMCPVLLLCGEYDKAGFIKRYNKTWTKRTGYPLVWIPKAGHMAGTDNPAAVNAQIEHFLKFVTESNEA